MRKNIKNIVKENHDTSCTEFLCTYFKALFLAYMNFIHIAQIMKVEVLDFNTCLL